MKQRLMQIAVLMMTMATMAMCFAGCGKSQPTETTKEEQTEQEAEETEEVQPKEPLVFENKKNLPLWKTKEEMPYYNDQLNQETSIIPYIAENPTSKGCVIICPGGGYRTLATKKEGFEPAQAFNEQGITAFVLKYRLAPYDYHAMLSDVCRAVRFVRYYAEDFGIDPDKIAIMGSSAGGHLASMNLTHGAEDTQKQDAIDKMDAQADFGILCYAVTTIENDLAHEGTRAGFLGEESTDDALAEKYSAHNHLTKDMSPCFVWHCKGDETVPYEGSEQFAKAMKKAGIECELHLYENGAHGIGLGTDDPQAAQWFPDCVKWLQSHGF